MLIRRKTRTTIMATMALLMFGVACTAADAANAAGPRPAPRAAAATSTRAAASESWLEKCRWEVHAHGLPASGRGVGLCTWWHFWTLADGTRIVRDETCTLSNPSKYDVVLPSIKTFRAPPPDQANVRQIGITIPSGQSRSVQCANTNVWINDEAGNPDYAVSGYRIARQGWSPVQWNVWSK